MKTKGCLGISVLSVTLLLISSGHLLAGDPELRTDFRRAQEERRLAELARQQAESTRYVSEVQIKEVEASGGQVKAQILGIVRGRESVRSSINISVPSANLPLVIRALENNLVVSLVCIENGESCDLKRIKLQPKD